MFQSVNCDISANHLWYLWLKIKNSNIQRFKIKKNPDEIHQDYYL